MELRRPNYISFNKYVINLAKECKTYNTKDFDSVESFPCPFCFGRGYNRIAVGIYDTETEKCTRCKSGVLNKKELYVCWKNINNAYKIKLIEYNRLKGILKAVVKKFQSLGLTDEEIVVLKTYHLDN